MEIPKVNKEMKARLEKWLELPDDRKRKTCPFYEFGKDTDCEPCRKAFPKAPICPCYVYSLHYVKRIAKRTTNDYYKRHPRTNR